MPNATRWKDVPASQRRELLTQEELCTRLDLCARQVRNLTRDGLPRLSDGPIRTRYGRYPWPLALHWYVAYKVAAGRRGRSNATEAPDAPAPEHPNAAASRRRTEPCHE